VLEITNPTRVPLSLFYGLWFDRVVPVLGRVAGVLGGLSARMRGGAAESSIADAYTYLPSSVKRFPGPQALAGEMERAGLTQLHYVITAGGIVAIHAGTVPAQRA